MEEETSLRWTKGDEGGSGERREAEHPGEPTARYARRGATIPAFPSSLSRDRPSLFARLATTRTFSLSLSLSFLSFILIHLCLADSSLSLSSPCSLPLFFLTLSLSLPPSSIRYILFLLSPPASLFLVLLRVPIFSFHRGSLSSLRRLE